MTGRFRPSATKAVRHRVIAVPIKACILQPVMNTPMFYGVALALANIVLSLVGFFLGFQTERLAQGQWFGLLSLVAAIVVLWLGLRAVREEAADKSLSYGKGVLTGFLISLYSGLIGIVYTFIHFRFINPSFVDYQIDATRQKWIQAGLDDAKMAAAEKFMRFFMSPPVISIVGFFMALVFGVIIALVLAAFLKRAPAATPPPAVSS